MIWDIYRPVLVSVLPKIGKRPDWTRLSSTKELPFHAFTVILAQVLTHIEKVLKLPTISFNNYKVTFMVP